MTNTLVTHMAGSISMAYSWHTSKTSSKSTKKSIKFTHLGGSGNVHGSIVASRDAKYGRLKPHYNVVYLKRNKDNDLRLGSACLQKKLVRISKCQNSGCSAFNVHLVISAEAGPRCDEHCHSRLSFK